MQPRNLDINRRGSHSLVTASRTGSSLRIQIIFKVSSTNLPQEFNWICMYDRPASASVPSAVWTWQRKYVEKATTINILLRISCYPSGFIPPPSQPPRQKNGHVNGNRIETSGETEHHSTRPNPFPQGNFWREEGKLPLQTALINMLINITYHRLDCAI